MDLFDHVESADVAGVVGAYDILWTLDRAISVFLNRWCHRALGDRDAAERELRALIEQSLREYMAETCRNAGCQEIR